MRRGFSLIELSIVLVIIGLLVGGILSGRSLIRSSELRSVGNDANRFVTAAATFRDQYKGLPGDLRDAQSYWGVLDATPATCWVTEATGLPTCNGDGNGTLQNMAFTSYSNEWFRFWQHLANAGLISGQYTGRSSGAALGTYGTTANNAPGSKIKNALWFVAFDSSSGGAMHDVAIRRHNMRIGGMTGTWPDGAIFTPEEALYIDAKFDDGKPGMGNTTAPKASYKATCTTGDTPTAEYNVSASTVVCTLYFNAGF